MREHLRHPFWQATLVLVAALVLIRWGVPLIPPLFGVSSAPVPRSVFVQYLLTVLVGILVWVSADEERWARFREPARSLMVRPEQKVARWAFLVIVPLLVAFVTWDTVRPKVTAPAGLRSVHPANPTSITVGGESVVLADAENPFREEGREEEGYELGLEVYYRNCMPCHGDYLDGEGPLAHGFNPAPLPLRGGGTIAQLQESYVFWRIAKGGPGLPREGAPWNSAMPAWEDFLTNEEMWAVALFLYRQTGLSPRTWEEH